MNEYSAISRELTKKISKLEKKNNGIYFTPPSCVNTNIQLLRPYFTEKKRILEPSCGSGEYITAIHRLFPKIHITGIEYNNTIYQSILTLNNDKVTIHNADYLQYTPLTKYDIIIGNPPYFVMKKDEVDDEYYPYFEGRPNIFILFIIKSFSLLNEDGILSFVLPKNFLNCVYYDKTRKYIGEHYKILYIIDCKDDKYIETQQDTILLIIQKTPDTRPRPPDNTGFILEKNAFTVFTNQENNTILTELYKKSQSLHELGFTVSVGNVVWNQCKKILTDDDTQTRLIYSTDIENNTLSIKTYKNEDKKNFINKRGITRPMIVINRGYGVGVYHFTYCLLEETKEYLVENHLICIDSVMEYSREELIAAYKKIISSLEDERTSEFIKIYFGNNAINTTELNHILPIYWDDI
jgi:type I restriction-modification system DNA methylase subunit